MSDGLLASKGLERAALAVREHARKVAETVGPHIELASVQAVGGDGTVEASIMGTSLTIDSSEDLALSQSVGEYHKKYGLLEHDTLLVMGAGDGSWLAFDVFSTRHVTGSSTLAQVLAAGADAGGQKITGLGTPAPTDVGTTAATKDYSNSESLNTQTGTSYMPLLPDAGGIIRMTYPGNSTVYVPRDDQVNFMVGTKFRVADASGVGLTTISPFDGTVSVSGLNNSLTLSGQTAYVWVIKVAPNTWEVTGDLAHGAARGIIETFAGASSLGISLIDRAARGVSPSLFGTSTITAAIRTYQIIPVTFAGQTTLSIVPRMLNRPTGSFAGTSALSATLGRVTGTGYVKQVASATSTTGSTTHTLTVTQAPASGDLLILSMSNSNVEATSVSDNRGNAWQLDQTSGASNPAVAVFSSMQNAATLVVGDVITVTFPSNVFNWAAAIHEVRGYTNASVDAATNANSGATVDTARAAGTMTTTNASDFLWSAFGAAGTETSFAPGAGWTVPPEAAFYAASATASVEFAYRVVSVASNWSPIGTGGVAAVDAGVAVAYQQVGSPTLSFVSMTNWARPANPTGGRSITFTTSAGLSSALTNMVAGDVITYTGTGVLLITSATGVAFPITNHNPASPVVIDFGCSRNIWNTSTISSNYVKFAYTGGGDVNAVTLRACSNLRFYGGDLTTNSTGGPGVINQAPLDNIIWYDAAIHDVGTSGMAYRPQDSNNVASHIRNVSYRYECDRWSMNPTHDTHPDRGTGCQACILHGITGELSSSTFAVWGHDPLQPGEFSAGQTWPEGGGGDVLEPGNDVGGPMNNLTLYGKGDRLKMIPNGTNPGSAGHQQTGGNILEPWGNVPLDNMVVPWLEGNDCTGANFHGTSAYSGWYTGVTMTVLHGRHTNMNQYVSTGVANNNIAIVYDNRFGVNYQDCL